MAAQNIDFFLKFYENWKSQLHLSAKILQQKRFWDNFMTAKNLGRKANCSSSPFPW